VGMREDKGSGVWCVVAVLVVVVVVVVVMV
jgi:hypothetical protein